MNTSLKNWIILKWLMLGWLMQGATGAFPAAPLQSIRAPPILDITLRAHGSGSGGNFPSEETPGSGRSSRQSKSLRFERSRTSPFTSSQGSQTPVQEQPKSPVPKSEPAPESSSRQQTPLQKIKRFQPETFEKETQTTDERGTILKKLRDFSPTWEINTREGEVMIRLLLRDVHSVTKCTEELGEGALKLLGGKGSASIRPERLLMFPIHVSAKGGRLMVGGGRDADSNLCLLKSIDENLVIPVILHTHPLAFKQPWELVETDDDMFA